MVRSGWEWILYMLIYAFFGWAGEVVWYALKDRKFVHRGFLNLPLDLPYGISCAILVQVLPTVGRNYVMELVLAFVVLTVVRSLSGFLLRVVSNMAHWETERALPQSWMGLAGRLLIAGAMLVGYHVFHPMLAFLVLMLPELVVKILALAFGGLVVADFFVMIYALRHEVPTQAVESRNRTASLGTRITDQVWRRIQKAYPGVAADPELAKRYTFAQGMCLDKLVWVFFISALLGDLIETLYCGLGGCWMSRSSVLYGPFSFVWGLGAVVLTVALRHLAAKSDRWVFLGGFVIGGAYEYLCSVFTELVYGVVFWDYSNMPLNIGGRTNVLYCFFWGILAVVWIKVLYPPMERSIEKLPVVAGKVLTWVIVVFLVCDAALTGVAMLRYDARQDRPEPANVAEEFLDENFDDDYMEARWPNMKVAQTE